MEQVYYTQCPMGYGLGASNGYQVKRITKHYPPSADFRILTLRAFLPGSRAMVPAALRYRRDGDVAEIAWLSPRDREFETEKGLWGRPGGHFAHGIRLDSAELAVLEDWPAGLFNAAFWKRSDPEASRGREPDPVEIELKLNPTLRDVSGRIPDFDPMFLAALLAATARAARELRTLYLIGNATVLADLIALLTFAFPSPLRQELTFSTYHDRPDELVGLRLQGTTPEARPNRAMLAGSGAVADLSAKTIDPPIAPAEWSSRLASWFLDSNDEAVGRFGKVRDRLARARIATGQNVWEDDWLDGMFGMESIDDADPSWVKITKLALWAGSVGLASDLSLQRPASWWIDRAQASENADARSAIVASLRTSDAWLPDDAEAWGRAIAIWFGRCDVHERHAAISGIWQAIRQEMRAPFLASLVSGLSSKAAEAILRGLPSLPGFDTRLLVPLQAGKAAKDAIELDDRKPLANLLSRISERSTWIAPALDAIEAVANGQSERIEILAKVIARIYVEEKSSFRGEVEKWALARPAACRGWLEPCLHLLFQSGDDRESWLSPWDRASEAAKPSLSRTALSAAVSPGSQAIAFLLVVEKMLLRIPEPIRPADPSWADAYLRRVSSDLDLMHKLYSPTRSDVKQWIYSARKRGEISSSEERRIDRVRAVTLALQSKDASALLSMDLPLVSPKERGLLLGEMLDLLGEEFLNVCLDCCRAAWPGGFDAGAEGLAELARPIAQFLSGSRRESEAWFAGLDRILASLHQFNASSGADIAYAPHGFAAEVLAATSRMRGDHYTLWKLRQEVLRDEKRWRILAEDARREFAGQEPETVVMSFREWDESIDQGECRSRFLELVFNVCDGPALGEIMSKFAESVTSPDPIPWWNFRQTPGAADDIREKYCRLAPMDPLPGLSRSLVGTWLKPCFQIAPAAHANPYEADLVPEDDQPRIKSTLHPTATILAQSRWKCLAAISDLTTRKKDVASQIDLMNSWINSKLPIDALGQDDASRFVSWVIAGLDSEASGQLDRIGIWLSEKTKIDPNHARRWWQGLPDAVRSYEADRVAIASELYESMNRQLREMRKKA